MRQLLSFLLALLLFGCSSEPDLDIPEGLTRFEMHEMVVEMNPLWDPVSRAITDARLLAGRRVAEDRYEFEAEYEVHYLYPPSEITEADVQRAETSMRAQGREAEFRQLEARRKAAQAYLRSRLGDMKPGDRRWFTDTFVLVRVGNAWIPESMAADMPKPD